MAVPAKVADDEIQKQEEMVVDEVKSIFAPFFIVEDGVISFSLRDLTIIGCVSISVALLTMLYQTC